MRSARGSYKNLPKKFIGGTLYDPMGKEVIIGAKCTLKDYESTKTFTTETDNFWDFWFHNLKDDGRFSLTLEKNGKQKTVKEIFTDKDLCLGNIPLAL